MNASIGELDGGAAAWSGPHAISRGERPSSRGLSPRRICGGTHFNNTGRFDQSRRFSSVNASPKEGQQHEHGSDSHGRSMAEVGSWMNHVLMNVATYISRKANPPGF